MQSVDYPGCPVKFFVFTNSFQSQVVTILSKILYHKEKRFQNKKMIGLAKQSAAK